MTALLLTLSLSSCGGEDSTTAQSPASPAPVAISPGDSSPQSPAGQSFAEPTVSPQNAAPKGSLPPDLISSTDPNQRVRVVQSNRPDPFALISTTPSVQIPPPLPVEQLPVPPAPTSSQASGQSNPTSATRQQSGQPSNPRGSSPSTRRSTPAKPVAPPPPQPELAKAVKVTGVVQVGSNLYAIVKAPNEPSSRYVQAGQSLSNGQVRVRRIETVGAEPKVVLEQFGIEIVRAVGEGGAPSAPGETPAEAPVTPNSSPAAALPAAALQG